VLANKLGARSRSPSLSQFSLKIPGVACSVAKRRFGLNSNSDAKPPSSPVLLRGTRHQGLLGIKPGRWRARAVDCGVCLIGDSLRKNEWLIGLSDRDYRVQASSLTTSRPFWKAIFDRSSCWRQVPPAV
jgi:hypothetical protein